MRFENRILFEGDFVTGEINMSITASQYLATWSLKHRDDAHEEDIRLLANELIQLSDELLRLNKSVPLTSNRPKGEVR